MKSIKFIGIAICIITLNSCVDNEATKGKEENKDSNRIEHNNSDRLDRNNDKTRIHNDRTISRDEDMTQLYERLNMSPEQIDSYERMETEHWNQQSNTDKTHGSDNWEIRRDQFLKDILKTEQYQRYEQWKRESNL